MKIIRRMLQIPEIKEDSVFIWGPRRVGKSYWLRHNFPKSPYIDLLKSDDFARYSSRPALLRERFQSSSQGVDANLPIIIDEIQKCPALLDEVHWLIENCNSKFILTGSSARKLRRSHANLLGGRALRREMRPLCFPEIENYNPEVIINSGLLPPHVLAQDPTDRLRAYISDYLQEEIAQEALVRNLPAFSEFLRVAAITNGEILNYSNVAREVGVAAKVVREYFQILEDTLLGFRIQPWSRSKTRRLVETEKFYFFDVGVSNFLARRNPKSKTPEFGKSFEHLILMELLAYKAYLSKDLEIRFWRTAHKNEVDFIVGDKELALEVKSSERIHPVDAKWLKVLTEDGPIKKRMIVCFESEPKTFRDNAGQVEVVPWRVFLERLWSGDLI
jgi:predicted AAA+ superfamily ATPase